MNLKTAPFAWVLMVCLPLLSGGSQRNLRPALVSATPYKPGAMYRQGETVGWDIHVTPDMTPGGAEVFDYTVKSNGQDLISSGRLEVSDGKAKVEVKPTKPMMVFLQVTSSLHKAIKYDFGAVVDAQKLHPVVPRPKDFDAFWREKIKGLLAVPENAEITPKDSGMPDVEYGTIKMDHVGGHHIYGQFAKPKGDGKYPAMVIFQWASPPYPLDRSWVTWRAKQGWLVVNIEPHEVLSDAPPAYYQALPQALKNYNTIGMEDRETSYFLQMYLADYRAVDYVTHRPDWNGKVLLVTGTSMGGQQSLCVAGLHPRITHLVVNEPAGCDQTDPVFGRSIGYPFLPMTNPKVAEAARYFDAVNFASHIRATSLVGMGFVDTVAQPAGIWTAFNEIRGKKEAAPMFDSPHNNTATGQQQKPITSRTEEWFSALVKGEPIPASHS